MEARCTNLTSMCTGLHALYTRPFKYWKCKNTRRKNGSQLFGRNQYEQPSIYNYFDDILHFLCVCANFMAFSLVAIYL